MNGNAPFPGRVFVRRRSGFTLIELTVVAMIVAIVVAVAMFAFFGAEEIGRQARSRAQVTRIHELLMQRWESYRYRRVPLNTSNPSLPNYININDPSAGNYIDPRSTDFARKRLMALRELMRMEMPDRKLDVLDGPTAGLLSSPPALWLAYNRIVTQAQQATGKDWSRNNQGSECLYMILSMIQDGDSNGLEYFHESEIGDTDNDGMKEILDAWGTPIDYLRWAPGYVTKVDGNGNVQLLSDLQDLRKPVPDPDPFDPQGVGGSNGLSFALYPLVTSAGPDRQYGILRDDSQPDSDGDGQPEFVDFHYNQYQNNPFTTLPSAGQLLGTPTGSVDHVDNITNHLVQINAT